MRLEGEKRSRAWAEYLARVEQGLSLSVTRTRSRGCRWTWPPPCANPWAPCPARCPRHDCPLPSGPPAPPTGAGPLPSPRHPSMRFHPTRALFVPLALLWRWGRAGLQQAAEGGPRRLGGRHGEWRGAQPRRLRAGAVARAGRRRRAPQRTPGGAGALQAGAARHLHPPDAAAPGGARQQHHRHPREVDRDVLRLSATTPRATSTTRSPRGSCPWRSCASGRPQPAHDREALPGPRLLARGGDGGGVCARTTRPTRRSSTRPEQVHAAQIVVKGLDDAKRPGAAQVGQEVRRPGAPVLLSRGRQGGRGPRLLPPRADAPGRSTRWSSSCGVGAGLGCGRPPNTATTCSGAGVQARRKRELRRGTAVGGSADSGEKRTEAQEAFEKELREKAQIQVNESTLQAIRGEAGAASGGEVTECTAGTRGWTDPVALGGCSR